MNRFSVSDLNCMVDLHLHLDGAISLESAKELALMQGISIPESDEQLLSMMRVDKDCSNLNEFLEKFEFPCSLLQTKASISLAVSNLLNELGKDGVMYAEIRFAPQKSTQKGLTQEEVVSAALEGIEKASIPAKLILCCMRGKDTFDANLQTVAVAEKFIGKGVAALDLAGAENLFPTKDFSGVFERAVEKGIPFTVHAGEADGAESIKTAISFGAKRIGHGVRALEDPNLVKELAKMRLPLELCPTSNICTGIFGSIENWPFEQLINNGLFVTVNTDDPSIEGTSIKAEYQKLIDAFKLDANCVKQLLLNAVNASFAQADFKESMISQINDNFKNVD